MFQGLGLIYQWKKIFHFFTAGSSFTERVDNEKDKEKI